MKFFRIGSLFLIAVFSVVPVHAGKNTKTTKTVDPVPVTVSSHDTEVVLDEEYYPFASLIKTVISGSAQVKEQVFTALSRLLPKDGLSEYAGFDELEQWLEKGFNVGGEGLEYCKSIGQKALIQLQYLKTALQNFIQYPLLYGFAQSSCESGEEQTDSSSHELAMRILASRVSESNFYHNEWEPYPETGPKKIRKGQIDVHSVVDVMSFSGKRRVQFLKQVVSSMTPSQRQSTQNYIEVIRENAELSAAEMTDGGCYSGMIKSAKRHGKKFIGSRKSKRIAAREEKQSMGKTSEGVQTVEFSQGEIEIHAVSESEDDSVTQQKKKYPVNLLAKELSEVIGIIKEQNLLGIEQGLKPSMMKADEVIAQRREKWQSVQECTEQKLKDSRKMYAENRQKGLKEWEELPPANTQDILRNCYLEIHNNNEEVSAGTEKNAVTHPAVATAATAATAALGLMTTLTLANDQQNAGEEISALLSGSSSTE